MPHHSRWPWAEPFPVPLPGVTGGASPVPAPQENSGDFFPCAAARWVAGETIPAEEVQAQPACDGDLACKISIISSPNIVF